MDDRARIAASAAGREALIAASYARLAGRPLPGADLWSAPMAVLAHGTEASPLFFYANRQTLEVFRIPAARLIGMESRLSAPPQDRAERAAMFARLEASHIVSGYRGIRVAGDGTRFMIEDAVIWNLVDEAGQRHGQAAAFHRWHVLD